MHTMIFAVFLFALQVSSHYVVATSTALPGVCHDEDIIFVIDESGSLWNDDFDAEIDFIKSLVDSFVIGTNNTRVSALTWASGADHEFYLQTYGTVDEIKDHLGNIVNIGGGSNLHYGLQLAKSHLLPVNGGREDARQIIIVFADGSYQDFAATQMAAQLKAENATVVFIAVYDWISQSVRNSVPTYPSSTYGFDVNSWLNLPQIKEAVLAAACPFYKPDCSVYGPGWVNSPVTNSCYRFVDKDKKCQKATNWCRYKSTTVAVPGPYPMLARIETQAENDWIYSQVQGTHSNIWIGATSNLQADGSVMTNWKDCPNDETHWDNFMPGEPSGIHGEEIEDCVNMVTQGPDAGKWNDSPRRKTMEFVCEIPLYQHVSCTGNQDVRITVAPAVVDVCLRSPSNTCDWGYGYTAGTNDMTCNSPCDGDFRFYA